MLTVHLWGARRSGPLRAVVSARRLLRAPQSLRRAGARPRSRTSWTARCEALRCANAVRFCWGIARKVLPCEAERGCALQQKDAGSWLWISMDDTVLNAVKKARLQAKQAAASASPPLTGHPRAAASGLCAAQMTKAHVGSLLVFDPSKMELTPDEKPDMEKTKREAVVGIVTERGALSCLPMLAASAAPYGGAVDPHGSRPKAWCGARADYLTKVVVVGKSSATLPVNDIMTPESKLMTVVPQQSVFDVMKMMMKYNFRHVPVVCTRAPECSGALPAAALRLPTPERRVLPGA